MIENEDIVDLLRIFNQHQVRFVLVGGYAVIHYAEPRYTKDVDLFVEATEENAGNILEALSEFGVPKDKLERNLFSTEGNFFKLGAPPWRVDLITSLKGVSFSEVYEASTIISVGGQEIQLISREDLIKVKKIAGRPQDLLDVEKLER